MMFQGSVTARHWVGMTFLTCIAWSFMGYGVMVTCTQASLSHVETLADDAVTKLYAEGNADVYVGKIEWCIYVLNVNHGLCEPHIVGVGMDIAYI